MITLKPEIVVALLCPAAARGISVSELAYRIIETVAADGMVDAVLDDADEVERVASLRKGIAA